MKNRLSNVGMFDRNPIILQPWYRAEISFKIQPVDTGDMFLLSLVATWASLGEVL